MMLGGTCLGSSALASLTPLTTSQADTFSTYPFTTLLRNVHVRDSVMPGISGEDTIGEVATATCVFVNPASPPVVGDPLEIRYFSDVVFSGTITDIERTIDPSHAVTSYRCTATDWAQALVRRTVRRSFTDLTLPQLVSSLLDNELSGEGFQFGSSDNQGLMELVDADNVSVFDVLRDVSGITGQVLSVEADKTLRFRSTSNPTAPFSVINSTVQDATQRVDRETYRNVQMVVAKGTAPEGTEAIEVQVILENTEQIAERMAIEGGSGRYEHMDKVTHPFSNTQTIVARLADTYAQVLLAVGGTPRTTLKARMKPTGLYGFRSGQVAPVNLTGLGLSGTWLIQKVSWREEDAVRLVYSLELVESSLQQRAWESWASIYRTGQLVVSTPGAALSANIASYPTAGSYQWVSPIEGTITITTMGGSAGGGGGARIVCGNTLYQKGGKGGASGKTVSSVAVLVGDVIDIVVGAKGSGGAGKLGNCTHTETATTGASGNTTTVSRSGVILSRAYGSTGGRGGTVTDDTVTSGYCISQGTAGSGAVGSGDNGIVTAGGGKTGGAGGAASCSGNPAGSAGQDGSVTIEY